MKGNRENLVNGKRHVVWEELNGEAESRVEHQE